MTRNGVCYNLKESPFRLSTLNFTFYFSSRFYKEKFEEQVNNYGNEVSESLSNRFKIKIESNEMACFILYQKIEKRGFCVAMKGEIYTCPHQIAFVGCPYAAHG